MSNTSKLWPLFMALVLACSAADDAPAKPANVPPGGDGDTEPHEPDDADGDDAGDGDAAGVGDATGEGDEPGFVDDPG